MSKKRTKKQKKIEETGITIRKSFKISFFLHILPILIMLFSLPSCMGCDGFGGGGGGQDKKQEKQADKPNSTEKEEIKEKEPVEVKLVSVQVQKSEEQLAYEAAVKKHEECKNYFGGIGITFEPFGGKIQKVYKYYPAWSAGLQDGDVLKDFNGVRGPIGTEVLIKYTRDGKTTEVKIKRGRICLEDAVVLKKESDE